LNLSDEPRAHAPGSWVARNDRSSRYVDEIEVDAGALWWRRDPDDLAGLGYSMVEDLIPRHNDREWSCNLTRRMRARAIPFDC
jgi:hypothetical protein